MSNSEILQLLLVVAAFSAVLLTLYLQVWRPYLRRPKLLLFFEEKVQPPYFRVIGFEPFSSRKARNKPFKIDFDGQEIYVVRPGLNTRVRVFNDGRSTAKNVQARIEQIRIFSGNSKRVLFYHPTAIKWSGESRWNPVDIVSKSHFFMDLFWVKNETTEEIVYYNYEKYRRELEKDTLEDIVRKHIVPSERVYWNVWVDTSWDRGIHKGFSDEGKISADFVINAENCDPLKFTAMITWTREHWNKPEIKVFHQGSFVSNC